MHGGDRVTHWKFAVAGLACISLAATAAIGASGADPLAHLSADVSAVLDVGKDPSLLLSESDHGVSNTRSLKVGDEYLDGWRITAIASTSVTLRKAGETQTISLSGRQATSLAAAPPPMAVAAVASTNAVVCGSPRNAPAGRSAGVASAITAGDVAGVLKMGGTAQDAAEAMAAKGALPPGANIDPSTASFVQIGDRYGIAFQGPNGNRQVLVTPDFADFVPTTPVRSVPAPDLPAGATGAFVTNGSNIVVRRAITAPAPPEAAQ